MSFSSWFNSLACDSLFWLTPDALIGSFVAAAGSGCRWRKPWKPTPQCSTANGRETKLNHQLVNILQHLTAEEPDISLRSWQRPKTERKETKILVFYSTHDSQWTALLLCLAATNKQQPTCPPYKTKEVMICCAHKLFVLPPRDQHIFLSMTFRNLVA